MKTQLQHIAIAKLIGWTQPQIYAVVKLDGIKKEYKSLPRKDSFSGLEIGAKWEKQEEICDKLACPSYELPDRIGIPYITQNLSEEQQVTFMWELAFIMGFIDANFPREDSIGYGAVRTIQFMCATQFQINEALLRTLGLWELKE